MIILLWAIKTNQQKYWLNLKVPRKKKQKHKDIGIEQKVNTIKSLMFYLNDIEFYIKELYINEKESYHRHYMLTKSI
jgi:hypothetical protein